MKTVTFNEYRNQLGNTISGRITLQMNYLINEFKTVGWCHHEAMAHPLLEKGYKGAGKGFRWAGGGRVPADDAMGVTGAQKGQATLNGKGNHISDNFSLRLDSAVSIYFNAVWKQ